MNPFGFTGYQRENVGGMLYAQARYYDPRNGRFNAEDGARDGLNWYEYARSNPLRFVDPSGLVAHPSPALDSLRNNNPVLWDMLQDPHRDGGAQVPINPYRPPLSVPRVSIPTWLQNRDWHFENRHAANYPLPTLPEAIRDPYWHETHWLESLFHRDEDGNFGRKFLHRDGREIVFDAHGNHVSGTFNYVVVYDFRDLITSEDTIWDAKLVVQRFGRLLNSYDGHFWADVLPFFLWGNHRGDGNILEGLINDVWDSLNRGRECIE